MGWLWPGYLLLLGVIPLIVAGYVWMLRRRRRFVVRYSSLSLVQAALPRSSWLRRHLPFVLFVAALASLALALARPVSIVSIPTSRATIILTIDVSGSMRSRDIAPSRLEAAESAAISFIQRQKAGTQIGIVAFSGFAELIQPPVTDAELLQSALESLTTGRRTAVGSGILEALDAIAEIDQSVPPNTYGLSSAEQPTPVPRGAYAPDIIVLLTDGESNAGPLPVDAAQQAADRGVRIYTIGYGTENGSVSFGGGQFPGGGGNPFGGNGGFGSRFRVGIDEPSLRKIADMTGGEYYSATSASELNKVFSSLPTSFITRHITTEISFIFAIAGALLAATAIFLALIWHPLL